MKVLLLNPPAERMIQRDHYCSLTTKANTYWAPIDLLMQSGILASEHEIEVLDAVVERLARDEALERIRAARPEAIVALSTVLSAREDLEFFASCKRETGCRIIVMGDVFYFRPELMIEAESVDAVCLQQATPAILDYLRGEPEPEDMVTKREGKIHRGKKREGAFSIPIPKHSAFPLKKYRSPLMRKSRFVPVLTTMGCPMKCSYCQVSQVDYRARPIPEVLAELDAIRASGIRELMMADLMFNADVKRAKQLCSEMIAKKYDFSWYAMIRPDKADPELLRLMKAAGCHTVMCGVETADPGLLRANQRPMNLETLARGFADSRLAGMRTLAFMILGLPGETHETVRNTVDFVLKLDCDYLSVNLFVPRCGSSYMKPYARLENVLQAQPDMDSTTTKTSHCELTPRELKRLKRRTLLRFYFRPKVLLRHFLSFKTWFHFRQVLLNGPSLLFRD